MDQNRPFLSGFMDELNGLREMLDDECGWIIGNIQLLVCDEISEVFFEILSGNQDELDLVVFDKLYVFGLADGGQEEVVDDE